MKTGVSVVSVVLASAMLLAVYAVAIVVPVTSSTEAPHTNANEGSFSIGSSHTPSGKAVPPTPHVVFGFTYYSDGVTPLNGCVVTVMNTRTGEAVVWDETRETWDPNVNVYVIDTFEFVNFVWGDILNVTAVKDTRVGWAESPVTPNERGYTQIDVTLNHVKFTMNLVTGRNFVSLPLVGYGYKASTLGLNSSDMVSEWNSTTKTYKSYIVGVPVNDFAISPGTGYWINVPSGTRTLVFYGIATAASQSKTITIPAGGGWAMVGFVGQNTTRHASDIPAMYSVAGGITMVSTWNPVTKTYTNWISVIPTINNFILTPGLAYWIHASTSGTLSYEPAVRPVASFTYTMDGLTVNVDASSSSGCDIVSYDWDWGDGTTGSGMIGTHTYPASVNSTPSAPNGAPCPPHPIWGFIYAADGALVPTACNVTLVNLRTGYSLNTTSDPDYGAYVSDACLFELGWLYGDLIRVTATSGSQTGWTTAPLTWSEMDYDQIDVVMGSGAVTIALEVTDALGQTASVSQTVKLVLPPIASFTLTVSGLTVTVDSSASSGQGGIVSYEWDWGDGTTGSGMIATHTYATSGSSSISSAYGMSGGGRNVPHPVFGYTYGPEGATLLYGCNVGVTNLRTGESVAAGTTPYDAVYSIDMNQFYLGWMFGDILNVTATKGDTYFGWSKGQVTDTPSGYDQIDVMLNLAPQPTEVTITLTVTDAIGQTDSVSVTVLLKALEPPVALISCPMDYLSVSVDGSCSIAPYGTIVSYDWTFGDGGVASGITASHTYVAPGTYMITLTVTDSHGLTASSSVQVTVPWTPGPP